MVAADFNVSSSKIQKTTTFGAHCIGAIGKLLEKAKKALPNGNICTKTHYEL